MLNVPSKSSRKATSFLYIVACFILSASSQEIALADQTYHRVAKALSGDSIQLESGSIIRYSSVEAPRLNHDSKKIRQFAEESLEFNRQLVEGKNIRVEWGSKLRDGEGRFQAFVFLEDESHVNLKALEAGYVKLKIEPPNLQYADELRHAASASRREQRGLWRHESSNQKRIEYIGDKMTKKFHFPHCEVLENVSKAHQRGFRSRVNALAAEFRFCSICRNKYSEYTDLF